MLRVYPGPKYDATISGTITDEAGNPVSHVEVQLFRAYAGGDIRSRKVAMTNAQGSYSFSKLREDIYILAVNGFPAPDATNPYITVFYPGTPREDEAERIKAHTAKPIRLDPLQVKRLTNKWIDLLHQIRPCARRFRSKEIRPCAESRPIRAIARFLTA